MYNFFLSSEYIEGIILELIMNDERSQNVT